MPKRICFLSAAHPALDKRVFHKEARSLAEAGFDTLHLCPDASESAYVVDDVQIVTYPLRLSKLSRLVGLLDLYRRARELSADAYHCNEPDSWLVGILLRLTTGSKVVFDCHEHYPGQVMRWLPRGTRRVGRVAVRVALELLGLMSHMVVLAKPSVAGDFSLSKGRHLLILNATSLGYIKSANPSPRPTDTKGPFTFVHFGVFRRERGSVQLLEAMRELLRRGSANIRVRLIGKFTDDSEQEFHAKASAWGLADLIESYNWMPFEEAFPLVAGGDAGLVLFQRTFENNVRGMPHKMFDYMVAGIPVIAPSFASDIARVIGPTQAGLLTDTADVAALADAMERLALDPEYAEWLGANGRKAVIETYNWEREATKLIKAYRGLLVDSPRWSLGARRD